MLRVLQDNGWAGKVKFVGFDASDNLVKSLGAGLIDALVVQDPMNMGYLGVKTVVAQIKGEKRRTAHRYRRPRRLARGHGHAGSQGAAEARPGSLAQATVDLRRSTTPRHG